MSPDRTFPLRELIVRVERVESTDPSSTDPSSTDPSSTDPSSTDPSSTGLSLASAPRTYTRVSCVTGAASHRPAYVLVPGIGMGVGIFERLAPRLLAHGDVYALDLPGFAGIHRSRRALTVPEYAELVSRALDHLELDEPVVIGHSMGTQIVIELAASRANLGRIVLISPVVPPWLRSIPRVATAFVLASLRESAGVALLALISYALTGMRSFVDTLPSMLAYRPEERIGDIASDVLLVRGQWDAVAPRPWLTLLADRARAARTVEIPGAAHSVMHRNAERVARLIVAQTGSLPRADAFADAVVGTFADASPATNVDERADAPADAIVATTEHVSAEASTPRRGWTPRLSAYALAARLREIAAIVRGDDAALARAKTSRIRVAIAAGEATDAPATVSAPHPPELDRRE